MKIFRISNVLPYLIAAVFGVLLFWTSQDVQLKERELSKLRKELAQEEETVRVLSVEWDYLNRPDRLEQLAKKELGMKLPAVTEMVRRASDIPEPLLAEEGMPVIEDMQAAIKPAAIIVPAPAAQAAPVKVQAVSFDHDNDYPRLQPSAAAPETVAPSTAERNSFDRLIESLDTGAGGAR